MEIKKLVSQKKHMIKRLIIACICIVFCAGIIFSVYQYKLSIEEALKKIEAETSQIAGKINTIKNNQKTINQAYENYKKIPKNKYPSKDNYTTSVSRQIVAKSLLTQLSKKYKFTDISPRLSPPQLSKKYPVDNTLSITHSVLSLRFEGMSDELVFAFIEDVQTQFPGYLKLTRLNIVRKGDIEKNILDKMKVTNTFLPIIAGNMEFDWYTVTSNPEEGGS